MAAYSNNFWKQAPFIKIVLAFIAGIIIQWRFQINITTWYPLLAAAFLLLSSFFFIPFFQRYRYSFVNGLLVFLLFSCLGAILTWKKDIRNNDQWMGHQYSVNDAIVLTIDEPLVEKTKSFKAIGKTVAVIKNDLSIPVQGKIIVYFKKDSSLNLSYGSRIIFKKPLQEIKNAGNPGGFDYKRYSLFQGITHQVYLKPGDYEVLDGKNENQFRLFIFSFREKILNILRKNIPGDRELGLAEALLIGYKNDLEQSLVQSYTNTGVVHIIAISGLHLGLIYWLLSLLLKPLKKRKKLKWLNPVLIIAGLWLFTLCLFTNFED